MSSIENISNQHNNNNNNNETGKLNENNVHNNNNNIHNVDNEISNNTSTSRYIHNKNIKEEINDENQNSSQQLNIQETLQYWKGKRKQQREKRRIKNKNKKKHINRNNHKLIIEISCTMYSNPFLTVDINCYCFVVFLLVVCFLFRN